MAQDDVNAFLTHLAVDRCVAAATQNQALAALLFVYGKVLERPLGELRELVRAKRPARLPTVLTRDEVTAVFARLDGTPQLVAMLLYGAGLRLLEALSLRVKDIDFARGEITVRDGKGRKDRVTMLPAVAAEPLAVHETVVQKAVRTAVGLAGLPKRASCPRSGTPSRPICSRTATTSAPSRSCSATRTSRRR